MRLLLTRPREDSEALAEALARRGHQSLIESLLSIEYAGGPPPDLDGVQAIVVTSANGVRALAAVDGRRHLPLFAVGDASARAARDCGFGPVDSAAGDVESLAERVGAALDPAAGALLHVAGSRVAGDLAGRVEGAGFTYRRAVLYQARKAERLSAATVDAINGNGIDGVLFFSPRTAATFVSLAGKARLAGACKELQAFCLSAAVAEKARDMDWRRIHVARRPDQESLLASIDEVLKRPAAGA